MSRLLLGLLLVLVGYFFVTYQAPCVLTYRLGTIDPRFGLSRDEALAALENAESIWEHGFRPSLFRYDENGQIVVSFLYDNRQRIEQENTIRKGAIARIGSRADRLKSRYERASAEYQRAKRSHLSKQSTYDADMAAHNRTVDYWNAHGGAPAQKFAEIHQEEARLDASAAALEKDRLTVNSLANRANRLSRRFNGLADRMNSHVAAINTTAGREFKQGLFTHDSSGTRIDVYEYTSPEDLVHVLAHEFGHALGIDHNDNPASIMYGVNSSPSAALTPEDLRELHQRCGS
jgi:hypothetical protein